MKRIVAILVMLVIISSSIVSASADAKKVNKPVDITTFIQLYDYRALKYDRENNANTFSVSDDANWMSGSLNFVEGLVPFACGNGTAYVDMETYGIMQWSGTLLNSKITDQETMVNQMALAISCLEVSASVDRISEISTSLYENPYDTGINILAQAMAYAMEDNMSRILNASERLLVYTGKYDYYLYGYAQDDYYAFMIDAVLH